MGVAAGLLVNVRQNAVVVLFVIVPLVAWEIRQKRGSLAPALSAVALVLAGFLAATAPFILANYQGTGVASPVPLGGFDLYLGNHLDGPRPYYNPVPFASTNPDTQGIEFTIEASRREGRELTLSEGSAFWIRDVVRIARDRPAAFARKLTSKALAVFHRWEEGDNHSIPFVSRFIPFFGLPFVAFWFVMPLGMAGLIVLARRSRAAAGLLAIVVVYVMTMVLVFPNMRIRAPLLVVLIPAGAAGLQGLLCAAQSRTRVATYAGIVSAFAVLGNLPVAGVGDLTAHLNTHAILLASRNQVVEAEEYWRKSSAQRGAYSEFADVLLASRAMAVDDLAAARGWLDRIPDECYAAPTKLEFYGDILVREGRAEDAAIAYRRSLSIRSGQLGVRQKLIDLYRGFSPEQAHEQEHEIARLSDFYRRIGWP